MIKETPKRNKILDKVSQILKEEYGQSFDKNGLAKMVEFGKCFSEQPAQIIPQTAFKCLQWYGFHPETVR